MKFEQEGVDTALMLSQHKRVLDYAIVGSARYLDEAKDLDFLVLAEGHAFMALTNANGDWDDDHQSVRWMFGSDWTLCGGEYDDQTDKWGAIRNGNVNLIVTVERDWYDRMKVASEVCTALKLADKGDRIVVHRVIRDGYSAEEANSKRDGSR
jgi:hypothetical protein